ncbi:MAG: leucine dehydrogenase [Flavobacteriales bacterium]|nr:leucine dehydrogenase [Flavobacteriales bacterium]
MQLNVLDKMFNMDHEQVVFCNDKKTGLKAIIAIHNTNLGPALGGTRMWNYKSEIEAFDDVLRLSRGMSLKASISGLNLGGGKAVIIGDAKKDKSKILMKRFGDFVESLNGKYITAEDVGITTKDMEYVRSQTKHVTGIPENMGGSGDPSPVTAYGVYMGIKASAFFKWNNDNLEEKTVFVQGVGKVGQYLVKYLKNEGARVFINDIDEEKMQDVATKYQVEIAPKNIFDLNIDIFSPCALGAVLNPKLISKLKCKIIAGGANNQLENEKRDSLLLSKRNIIFAPDFLINAGGLINVYSELKGKSIKDSMKQTEEIYNTTLEIFERAKINDITSYEASLDIAEQRIYSKQA